MPVKIGPEENNVVIKFGGGLHTRASADDIDPTEAADGKNFILDLQNKELRPRPPFDLIGTVPNGLEIRGGGSLLKSDGTISTIIQAAGVVYEWDGEDGFTSVGNVSSSAKLRGHWRSHNWQLDDELLLTDLELADTVKKWDGATFASVSFTNEAGSGFGNFYAKYLNIANERAVFFNVKSATTPSPHMIVGSERGNYTIITISDRPSSSLSEQDPFFLLTPDLRPINGAVEAFGTTIVSSQKGQLFNLTGNSAKDFSFDPFYPGSAASGDEALAYVGNDIFYGRQGRIESVTDTDRYGNSTADDLTSGILDQVKDYTGWLIVYNARLHRTYMFPSGVSEVWVFDNSLRGGQVSPWMRWRTTHSMAFTPTFAMAMLDPLDGLEYVIMGDASGNLYRMEGEGEGDGGTSNIEVEFLTRSFKPRLDTKAYDFEGFIRYRKTDAVDIELIFEYAGVEVFNETVTVGIPALSGANYYGGDAYYGGDYYYGSIAGRVARQPFIPPGQANEFQVRIKASSTKSFAIPGIEIRWRAASS